MDINLDEHEVLIIAGPQGCGKTSIALKMAEALGTFTVTDNSFLNNNFKRGGILAEEHDTIIIEEFTPSPKSYEMLKSLVSEDLILVERMHKETQHFEAPTNIILCTGDVDALRIPHDSRRFFVLEMPAK